jgi:hypothetical protein
MGRRLLMACVDYSNPLVKAAIVYRLDVTATEGKEMRNILVPEDSCDQPATMEHAPASPPALGSLGWFLKIRLPFPLDAVLHDREKIRRGHLGTPAS